MTNNYFSTFKRNLKHYQDPEHGWVLVSREDLKALGLEDKISTYSYQGEDGENVYLEEDCDFGVYVRRLDELGIQYEVKDLNTNRRHWIRSLPAYQVK